MIQILFFTGLMAIFHIEAVNVQAVHTEEIIGVVAPKTDSTFLNVSENVQVFWNILEVPKVITGYNKMGFSTEVWIL